MPTFFEKQLSPKHHPIQSSASIFEIANWFDKIQTTCNQSILIEDNSILFQEEAQTLINVGFLFPIICQYLIQRCRDALRQHSHTHEAEISKEIIVRLKEFNSDIHQYQNLYHNLNKQKHEYKNQTDNLIRTWETKSRLNSTTHSSSRNDINKLFRYTRQFYNELPLPKRFTF